MKKEEIHLTDWQRIFIGNNPAEFLIEVLVRTLLIYLFLLVIVRLLGKRMNGQLSISEMAVMLTLGALVSPAMQIPDRGLIIGFVVLTTALLFYRGVNLLEFISRKFERIAQGKESMIIKDGVMQLEQMTQAMISKQQLFAVIRSKKIYNLSKVKRLYLESCGVFSLYEDKEDKPGLSVLPMNDEEVHGIQQVVPDKIACQNCGHTVSADQKQSQCPSCEKTDWTNAVL